MNAVLNRLSLGTKIIGNAVVLLSLFVLCAGYTVYAMNSIERELTTVSKRDIPLTEHVAAITAHQLRQTIEFERALRFSSDIPQDNGARREFQDAIARFDKEGELVDQQLRSAGKVIDSLQSTDERTQREFSAVARRLKQIDVAHEEFANQAQRVFSALSEGRAGNIDTLVAQVKREADELDQSLTALLDDIGTFTEASAMTALEHEQDALSVIVTVVTVSTLFGLLVSWYVSRSIVRGVKRAIVTASGDLTQEIQVDSSDEIGELLGAMNGLRQKLLNMISQISGTTAQLAAASEEMSVVTDQTSRTIDEQRSETEQVATAMNEMSATAQEIAISVNQTATAVTEASEHSNQGSRTVQDTIDQIQTLAHDVDASAKAISEVEEYSKTISTVIEVIQAIAEQTNLLALNAAIEAARAGDQGRGFAVVADEVRALASRTQHSTNEINDMISKLQTVSHKAVESMMSNKTQVGATVTLAGQAGQALRTIDQAMARINDMATQIASASEEQVGVAEEINTNIARINEMTYQTAQGAEETANASRDLTRMASDLRGLVAQFQV
ncbi:methyl-accepting chemotaxis protein [Marinobacter nanhaiticus D15-8W]|uniref:Methyl-accepting chemotaxis protein n=1 Tax=Marinobacter nanhaiticus D15-8W TaxID=626887 RepID=N6WY42_9GAMM|nr:methyl-accepting chemotaxis protein [Marinobacter nanhaiticus]ENO16526.1 methyl-accepting chemotaxis protein [Marinobacter nanhaiticus D15-8W]BES72317.1 methyl-accepting chemotaxis protein [Marinobacter nanhaiticus D15-8W]